MDESEKGIRRIPFDGVNFLIWKCRFTAWADGMGYTPFMSAPAGDQVLTAEETAKGKKLKASLGLSLEPIVLGNFVHLMGPEVPPHLLWNGLVQLYERKNIEHKHALREELYSQSLQEDEEMSSYTQRILQVVCRLQNVDDRPSDNDIVYALLKGLSPEYNTVVSTVRLSAANLTSTELIPILMDHQSTIRRQMEATQPKSLHFAKRKHTFSKQAESHHPSKKQSLKCDHCGKAGHQEETCWNKNPSLRPQWLKRREQSRQQRAGQTAIKPSHAQAISLLVGGEDTSTPASSEPDEAKFNL